MSARIVLNRERLFSNDRATGRLMVLVSAVGFGTIGPASKLAYGAGLDTPMLLALRFLVAAAALWLYFAAFNRSAIRISRKQLATCAALGLAGYGIFSTLTFKAFESAPASTVGLLFFSYPVFVMLLDWATTRARPDWQLALGAFAILSGISVGVLGTTNGYSAGLLLAVGGAAWYAAYVVATRRLLQGLRPQTVALYVASFAAIGFWIMGSPALENLKSLTASAWAAALWLGLVSTVMALLTFFSGLEKLGAAEASQMGTFELIVSLTLAATVLGEPVSLPLVLGASLILAGIVMSQMKPSRQPSEYGVRS